MRLRDMKDALLGCKRRKEELENAVRFIQLAVTVAIPLAADENHWDEHEAMQIINEKCQQVLGEK